MIHKNNKEGFIAAVELAAKKKGFLPLLMEKDYYLTLILSKLSQLSEGLIFKGGSSEPRRRKNKIGNWAPI